MTPPGHRSPWLVVLFSATRARTTGTIVEFDRRILRESTLEVGRSISPIEKNGRRGQCQRDTVVDVALPGYVRVPRSPRCGPPRP